MIFGSWVNGTFKLNYGASNLRVITNSIESQKDCSEWAKKCIDDPNLCYP
ncbi:MAG: hypothetical protein ACFFG0_48630 [Candidatus Thorarchaeota archaeon]